MADELINYKLQLQQVEAALTNSPDDPELLKLKTDLEEVIELTTELVKTQVQPKKEIVQSKKESSYQPDILPSVSKTKDEWKSGDRCLAQLADDGKFYEGTIETIDGEAVAVLIDGQKSAAVTTLDYIKDLPRAHPNEMKHKKQPIAKYREYQKKRKLAKQQRFKQLEEEREVEKNKWLAFANKVKGVKKGIPKKSIFASPDNVNGRVGIGTCGLGGKGMTDFPMAEKRKK
ncbi:survival of motor neuron-related-splicing factor 30 isoform X1 [Daktulosphaira vitifoliae]|uniref:survival of motor neuron-related-splicing factor 30 isoform X1 n=1 Tax=Daktulosphaira vitifoliae TaxID=58002 RepID=UPI0021A9DC57|nr:survival of motor neuron-related-splicing factor 30 isoform X1 [Daktulosphaira vitifoliae]